MSTSSSDLFYTDPTHTLGTVYYASLGDIIRERLSDPINSDLVRKVQFLYSQEAAGMCSFAFARYVALDTLSLDQLKDRTRLPVDHNNFPPIAFDISFSLTDKLFYLPSDSSGGSIRRDSPLPVARAISRGLILNELADPVAALDNFAVASKARWWREQLLEKRSTLVLQMKREMDARRTRTNVELRRLDIKMGRKLRTALTVPGTGAFASQGEVRVSLTLMGEDLSSLQVASQAMVDDPMLFYRMVLRQSYFK